LHSTPRIHLFELKGTFDGKAFALGVYFQYRSSPSASPTPVPPDVQVLGTYGNEPVRATLVQPASDLTNPNAATAVLFNGTIGAVKVSGRITEPDHNGAKSSVTTTFAVAG